MFLNTYNPIIYIVLIIIILYIWYYGFKFERMASPVLYDMYGNKYPQEVFK